MNQSPFLPSIDSPSLPAILSMASQLMGARNYDGAIAAILSAQELVRREPVACNTLAFLLLQVDRPDEAIPWFETALALQPGYAQAISGLGMACLTVGDLSRALQCYDETLASRPQDAKSWYYRGVALSRLWRLEEALSSLDRAIALNADYVMAFTKRSHILESLGNFDAAIGSAMRSCTLSPSDASSWFHLGDLLRKSGNPEQGVLAYEKGLALSPTNIDGLCGKAHALNQAGREQEALLCSNAVLAIDPTDRQALVLSGNLELKLGDRDVARQHFLAVARKGVAASYLGSLQPPKFRALLLFSPFAGNTPYEDLIRNASFDADLAILLKGHRHDPDVLNAGIDVVVNLISDADLGLDMIGALGELVASLRRPVINHPALVLGTDRERISNRLSDVRGVVMPRSVRSNAADLLRRLRGGETHDFPLIVRHAGTHGGEKMEMASEAEALLGFVEQAGESDLYLTDFIDYRSADGFFRKYRFVFVGEEILPYHLAIGDVWKVHHTSTRMTEFEWMRDEERAFLEEPGRVFGAPAMAALDLIRRIIGLDYLGIDCSLDADGNVLVFEVNATMLIHLHNEGFDYKTPHVMRIKAAFERLLESRANAFRATEIKATGPSPVASTAWNR